MPIGADGVPHGTRGTRSASLAKRTIDEEASQRESLVKETFSRISSHCRCAELDLVYRRLYKSECNQPVLVAPISVLQNTNIRKKNESCSVRRPDLNEER